LLNSDDAGRKYAPGGHLQRNEEIMMSATHTSKLTVAARAVAVATLALAASHAQADMSVAADVQARVGVLDRSGGWNNGYTGRQQAAVDGNMALWFSGTRDLKGGYSAGFNCASVATTTNGALAAYDGSAGGAMPVHNGWDKAFVDNENWANNGHGGGFASYGDLNGDNKGVLCNDEVYGSLGTPYGTFRVGNIMNPMRLLYDATTVDPIWGNQRAYYALADLRGNALRYSHSIGQFNMELQFNTPSNYTAKSSTTTTGQAQTAFVSYDMGNGTLFGAGAMHLNGANVDKTASYSSSDGAFGRSYGVTAKTLLGPVTVAYTYMRGGMGIKDIPDEIKRNEHMVKIQYDWNKWSFQSYLSRHIYKAHTVAAWGGSFTVDNSPVTFERLKVTRNVVDLWALYNVGIGATTYARINWTEKKYTALDANYKTNLRATKYEAGWLMHF